MSYMYNSIYLQMVKTTEFEAVQERDPTGTDAVWTKYTIRVKGFLTVDVTDFPGVGSISAESVSVLNAVKSRLEAPRREMYYKVNGETLVSTTGMDAKIGPEPLPCVVREISAGTFYVECGCIVRLVDCISVSASGISTTNAVVSLRWSQSERFDQNWNSHIHTEGKLIVRSDLLRSADSFRPLCVPSILPNYLRTTSKYTLSPDGTILDFHFEDVEQDRMPGPLATKASGVYRVVMNIGGRRDGTVQINLEGPKGTSRKDLLALALAYAYSKILDDDLAFSPSKTPLIMGGEVTEDLWEPRVSVSLQARLNYNAAAGTGALGSFASRPRIMPSVGGPGVLVALENYPGLAPPDRKRLRGLLAAAFRDPCAALTGSMGLTTSGTPPSFAKAPGIVDGTPGSTSSIIPSIISIGTGVVEGAISSGTILKDSAPYDVYEIDITSRFHSGQVQMPATGVGPSAGISSVVTATGEMMNMVAVWVAGRSGKPPQLPTYQTQDSNLVPIQGAVVTKEVIPTADGGQPMFLTSGFYEYAILDPSLYRISAGVPPYLSSQFTKAGGSAAGFWTGAAIELVNSLTPAGTNPFVDGGVTPDQPPQLQQGFGAGVQGQNQGNQQGQQQGQNNAGVFSTPPVGA